MSIILKKGGRVDLSKEAPTLKRVMLGLGWDANDSDTGEDFDLDVSLFMLNSKGKIPENSYFIFYNNLNSPDGSVSHNGDNRTGEGDSDDETISIDLEKIDDSIKEIVVIVTIDNAQSRKQNFGQINNSFIRLYDVDTDKEICKYELDEDFSTETAVEFGRLYKKNGSWRFKAVGFGFNSGLEGFVEKFVG
jgi:tellurium resistance protein TerD